MNTADDPFEDEEDESRVFDEDAAYDAKKDAEAEDYFEKQEMKKHIYTKLLSDGISDDERGRLEKQLAFLLTGRLDDR